MKKGSLNRRIRIERREVTRDPNYGTSQSTWKPLATVWAEVRDVLPSRAETVSDEISIQRRPARVRMLYRSDISADMRVIYQDRIYEIIGGPAEIGRREGLEMVIEELSTRGEAP